MSSNQINDLIARQKPGYSLEQPFYVSDELFAHDVKNYLRQDWHMVGHVSRIPEVGQYFVTRILDEEIIVVRGKDKTINVFYNVCTHRGSRICAKEEGKANLLVCPYHAWTFGLDGELRQPPDMPEHFDRKENGLRRCHVGVAEGVIFVNLFDGEVEPFLDEFGPFFTLVRDQDLASTKVAARKVYPCAANWKLVVENYLECYHCRPSHPQFCDVHSLPKFRVATRNEADIAAAKPEYEEWSEQSRALGYLVDSPVREASKRYFRGARRLPIGKGMLTESEDGKPVAPLLSAKAGYDGGTTIVNTSPTSWIVVNNDHAILFRFTPINTMETEMELTWLVHPEAIEGKDYDLAALMWLWDVTNAQDKQIITENQRGILSSRYRPGCYATVEGFTSLFVQWYLARITEGPPVHAATATRIATVA